MISCWELACLFGSQDHWPCGYDLNFETLLVHLCKVLSSTLKINVTFELRNITALFSKCYIRGKMLPVVIMSCPKTVCFCVCNILCQAMTNRCRPKVGCRRWPNVTTVYWCQHKSLITAAEFVGPRYRIWIGMLSQVFWVMGYIFVPGVAYLVRGRRDLELVFTILYLPPLVFSL